MLIVEFPRDTETNVCILHWIPSHGVISVWIEVLVKEIITNKQVHAFDVGGSPNIKNWIRGEFNIGVCIVKLSSI